MKKDVPVEKTEEKKETNGEAKTNGAGKEKEEEKPKDKPAENGDAKGEIFEIYYFLNFCFFPGVQQLLLVVVASWQCRNLPPRDLISPRVTCAQVPTSFHEGHFYT